MPSAHFLAAPEVLKAFPPRNRHSPFSLCSGTSRIVFLPRTRDTWPTWLMRTELAKVQQTQKVTLISGAYKSLFRFSKYPTFHRQTGYCDCTSGAARWRIFCELIGSALCFSILVSMVQIICLLFSHYFIDRLRLGHHGEPLSINTCASLIQLISFCLFIYFTFFNLSPSKYSQCPFNIFEQILKSCVHI